MIEITNVTKRFTGVVALNNITAAVGDGHVFGLIGTNGSGKSTLMRILCGVYRPDSGSITIDGEAVFENINLKSQIFYISDEQFFYNNGTVMDMLKLYQTFYVHFDADRFLTLLSALNLDKNRRINTFSKGMKKQVSILLGICSNTKYLLCDETFDGLDPVMRQAVKSLFIQEIDRRGLTPIIASHNLRELEDICDHVGLLHNGGILFNKDLDEMKLGIHKLQCVLKNDGGLAQIGQQFEILKTERRVSLLTLTLRGCQSDIIACMENMQPVFYEILPLSLEEIFISETEVQGYDFKHLIL